MNWPSSEKFPLNLKSNFTIRHSSTVRYAEPRLKGKITLNICKALTICNSTWKSHASTPTLMWLRKSIPYLRRWTLTLCSRWNHSLRSRASRMSKVAKFSNQLLNLMTIVASVLKLYKRSKISLSPQKYRMNKLLFPPSPTLWWRKTKIKKSPSWNRLSKNTWRRSTMEAKIVIS